MTEFPLSCGAESVADSGYAGPDIRKALQTPTGAEWAPAEVEAVLEAARTCQTPTRPTGCGGKTWHQIRTRLKASPEFKAAWDEARAEWVDSLELVVQARARDGWTRTIEVQDGSGVIKERRISEEWDPKLAMGILAAQRRETYGKRETIEHTTGEAAGGLQVVLTHRQPEPESKSDEGAK